MADLDTPLVGIVADDLTGSIDTGGAFAAHGLSVSVVLSPSTGNPDQGQHQILCFNTNTRNSLSNSVVEPVHLAARRLLQIGYPRLYKKTDSTMRGHVGLETTAMMGESGLQLAFVCPAFPSAGRTVRDGILLVGETPVTEVQEGREPLKGVRSASVKELLEQETGLRTGLVALADIQRGQVTVESRVDQLLAQECRIVVLDAETQKDMETIAVATERYREAGLVAGSAGLAHAMATVLESRGVRAADRYQPHVSTRPILLVSGSLHPATQAQLHKTVGTPGLTSISVDADAAAGPSDTRDTERKRLLSEAGVAFRRGDDVVLHWSHPDRVWSLIGDQDGSEQTGVGLSRFLGDIARSLVQSTPVSGLIVVGGDTAHHVLGGLDTESITLGVEVLPGISMGTLVGGVAGGRFVVAKAGGFGNEDALVTVVGFVRRLRDSKS